jgi:hypothetical protein
MAPLRSLAEDLGWTVSWSAEDREILVKNGKTDLALRPDRSTALVEGDMLFQMPAPVQLVDGRAFVPLRFICEQMKLDVSFDQENRITYIFREDQEYHLYADGRTFTLVVSNQTDEPRSYQFSSSKTHDFIIRQGESVVWSQSEGRMYLTVISDRELGPGQCWTFQDDLARELDPGDYTLEAWFTGWDGRYYIKDPNPVASIGYTVPQPDQP